MYTHVKTILINLLMASLMIRSSSSACEGENARNRSCSCYKFYSQPSSWTKSNEKCKKAGGYLVSMETKEEWQFIRDQIQDRSTKDNEWHIGLKKTDSVWTWVSGKRLNWAKCEHKECFPWQKGEPSGWLENVGLMARNYPDKTKGLFNDIKANTERGFICEHANETCKSGTEPTPVIVQKATDTTSKPITQSTSRTIKTSTTPKAPVTTTTSSKKPESHHAQPSISTSEIQTSANTGMFHGTPITDYSTQAPPTHTTSETNEPEQPVVDSGASPNSTVIIALVAGISVLVIATVILLLIILWRRKSQKKQIQQLHNDEGLALNGDGQQVPAQDLYEMVDKSNNMGKKPAELVYADLTLSRGEGRNEVIKPKPYVPTVYADIRLVQAPAPANQEEEAVQKQDAEDPTYAGIV